MASSRRPIDPPDLPAWRRTRGTDEDETPTLTGLEGHDPFESEETQWEAVPPTDSVAARWASVSPAGFVTETDPGAPIDFGAMGAPNLGAPDPVLTPQPLGAPQEDPRALAQRLAAEAKSRMANMVPEARHEPTPAPEPLPPPEDPRELARRLAAEARARIQAEAEAAPAPEPPPEDPRELARRLAAEAKARIATPAPAAPRAEDPRELAKRLAAEAKARVATPAPAPAASPPPPAKKGGLASRAAAKPKSAKEILEAALRHEEEVPPGAWAPAPPPDPLPEVPEPEVSPPEEPEPGGYAVEAPLPEPDPRLEPRSAPDSDAAAVILGLLPKAAVEQPTRVHRPDVFQAVFRAHRTRALHESDWATAAAASVLIDAADRLRSGALVGAKVQLAGGEWAVFADVDRPTLLAVLRPADVYLAGLG